MPAGLRAAAMAEAERRGLSLTDFIGLLVSDATGEPYALEEATATAA